MGYMVELNTLLGLPGDFDKSSLEVGRKYTIIKDNERAFPLHIAVIMIDKEWNFYGYAVVHSAIVKDQKTVFEFEVLTLFPEKEREIYSNNFKTAGKMTGEVK